MESDEMYIKRMLEIYHHEITQLLIHYGNLSEAESIQKQQPLWDWVEGFESIDDYFPLFHEVPYYWAMDILYGGANPQWYLDSKLWPPPQEYTSFFS